LASSPFFSLLIANEVTPMGTGRPGLMPPNYCVVRDYLKVWVKRAPLAKGAG